MKIKYFYELEQCLSKIKNSSIIDLTDANNYEKVRIISFLAGFVYKTGKLEKIEANKYKLTI